MSGALGRVSFCLYNPLNNFAARVIKRLLIPQRQKFYCMGYLLILKYSSKCVSFCDNSKTLYYLELTFKRRFVIVRDIKSGNWGISPKKYYLMFPWCFVEAYQVMWPSRPIVLIASLFIRLKRKLFGMLWFDMIQQTSIPYKVPTAISTFVHSVLRLVQFHVFFHITWITERLVAHFTS